MVSNKKSSKSIETSSNHLETHQARYINREFSLLDFNYRVLLEAQDRRHPLLERLKFISIFSTNMDEFFMIRYSGLKRQVDSSSAHLSIDGLSPLEQINYIRQKCLQMYKLQEDILLNEIFPELEQEGIIIRNYKNLTDNDKEYLRDYFIRRIFPMLTPQIFDKSHPFPNFTNRLLNIVFVLRDPKRQTEDYLYNFVQINDKIERLVRINNGKENEFHYVLVENIIKANGDLLFPGYEVISANTFKVTRDADIDIVGDEAGDLLSAITEGVKFRYWKNFVVRLQVSTRMSEPLVQLLIQKFNITENDVYRYNRILKLDDFLTLTSIDKPRLKYKPFKTRVPPEFRNPGTNIFDCIKNRDILVHHPFDTFTNSVIRFFKTAAIDPYTTNIKMTLYRVGNNAPVVDELMSSLKEGKDVTAFVELKARFDEESNIRWAQALQEEGARVIHGVLGLKTHCKIALVIRKEPNGKLRGYLHLSTGNYNSNTAKIYTDIGLFTADEDMVWDGIQLFNVLTGYSRYLDWKKFAVAPYNLKEKTIELILREAEYSSKENPGEIFCKLNSLTHKEIIDALYEASQKGVRIRLLVRGICCLVPGIKGLSENIEVRSILGRFLEHSRIFYFKNNGNPEVYLSSADWMERNLDHRIEIMFPIENSALKQRLKELLEIYWADNVKSWRLLTNKTYEKIHPAPDEKEFCAQEYLLKKAEEESRMYPQTQVFQF
ncbi:MAG: polyphosphate kinase 1 [Candidatus Kapaibacteriales bacterium]